MVNSLTAEQPFLLESLAQEYVEHVHMYSISDLLEERESYIAKKHFPNKLTNQKLVIEIRSFNYLMVHKRIKVLNMRKDAQQYKDVVGKCPKPTGKKKKKGAVVK